MNYKNKNMGGNYLTTHISKSEIMSKTKFVDAYIKKPCAFLGIANIPGDFCKLTEEKFNLAKKAGCVVSKLEGEKIEGIETVEKAPTIRTTKKTAKK